MSCELRSLLNMELLNRFLDKIFLHVEKSYFLQMICFLTVTSNGFYNIILLFDIVVVCSCINQILLRKKFRSKCFMLYRLGPYPSPPPPALTTKSIPPKERRLLLYVGIEKRYILPENLKQARSVACLFSKHWHDTKNEVFH